MEATVIKFILILALAGLAVCAVMVVIDEAKDARPPAVQEITKRAILV